MPTLVLNNAPLIPLMLPKTNELLVVTNDFAPIAAAFDKPAFPTSAFSPTSVILAPVVFVFPALKPTKVLSSPLVLAMSVLLPKSVLLVPSVLAAPDLLPKKALSPPVVFRCPLTKPKKAFSSPVSSLPAESPTKVFSGEETKPPPIKFSELDLPHLSSGGEANGSTKTAEIRSFYNSPPANNVEKRPSGFIWKKILPIGIGVLLLSAVGFGFYQFYLQRTTENESQPAPIEQIRFQHLTDDGDVIHPTISPNGELLVYVRQQEDGESLRLKPLATGNPVQVLPPSRKGYRSLAFSPDGNYLFFRENAAPAAIYQTTPYGGAPKKNR